MRNFEVMSDEYKAVGCCAERSPLRDLRGSPGSRGKLVARRWNGLLPQRHF